VYIWCCVVLFYNYLCELHIQIANIREQKHTHTKVAGITTTTLVANVNKLGSCYQFPLLVAGYQSSRCARTLTLSSRYSENPSLNLKFCVALCNAILKSHAKNEENLYISFLPTITFLLIRVLS